MSRSRWWALALLIAALFVAQGAHLAGRLVTWTDESAYVHLGYLATVGEIDLFQDELPGSRVPLPFYVVGLSQVLWGRSLMAGRVVSLAFGVIALVLTGVVARRLAGNLAGLLAMLFIATQGVLVGYLVTATYHALAAMILAAGLALAWGEDSPRARIEGMAVISVLFLVRTNLWVILPAMLLLLWLEARTARERALLVVACLAVPIAFFASNSRHVRMLVYVPVLKSVAMALGYPDAMALNSLPPAHVADLVRAVGRLLRMFEFWALAAALLAALVVLAWRRGEPVRTIVDRRLGVVLALLAYIGVCQVGFSWHLPSTLPSYLPSWAPLMAVALGVGFARVLSTGSWTNAARATVVTVLIVVLALPIVIVRHPLLPIGPDARTSPMRDLDQAATHFRRLIPSGPVFLFGDSLPLYLAGLTPYLRQIHASHTLSFAGAPDAIRRSGYWGMTDLERWLGSDARYAVIEPVLIEANRARFPEQMARFMALLSEHFDRVERVDDYRWLVFDVYVRRGAAAGGAPAPR